MLYEAKERKLRVGHCESEEEYQKKKKRRGREETNRPRLVQNPCELPGNFLATLRNPEDSVFSIFCIPLFYFVLAPHFTRTPPRDSRDYGSGDSI